MPHLAPDQLAQPNRSPGCGHRSGGETKLFYGFLNDILNATHMVGRWRSWSGTHAIWLPIHLFLTRPPNVIILAVVTQAGSPLGLGFLGSGVWSESADSRDYIPKAEECVAGPGPVLPSTKPHSLLVVEVAS